MQSLSYPKYAIYMIYLIGQSQQHYYGRSVIILSNLIIKAVNVFLIRNGSGLQQEDGGLNKDILEEV